MIQERKESREGIDSDAAAVRSLLDDVGRAERLESEVERLESEVERLRTEHESEMEQLRSEFESKLEQKDARIQELTDKLAAAHDRVETTNDLVRAVEDEQSIQRQKAQASLVERFNWWVRGMPTDDE